MKNSIAAGNWNLTTSVVEDCSVGTGVNADYNSAGYNLVGDQTGAFSFTGSSSAYSDGGPGQKSLGSGAYGLFACDANFDRIITAPDFNIWNANTTAGAASRVPD